VTAKQPSRVVIGTTVISVLGISFGMAVVIGASFMTWRSDSILGLYNRTGWHFNNIVSGDGKISLILGLICFSSFILGGALRRRAFYGVSFFCSLAILALDVYELIFLWTRPGVVSPGSGLYAILGGCVVGILCSLGGYLMLGTGLAGAKRHILKESPQTN
jgi:hypothetical protein